MACIFIIGRACFQIMQRLNYSGKNTELHASLESTVSSDTCRMYVGTLDGFVCSTLQDELNCVPNGSYVVVLNPTSSTYTSDTMQTRYSSDTVIILYLPLPEPEPVLEVVLPEP